MKFHHIKWVFVILLAIGVNQSFAQMYPDIGIKVETVAENLTVPWSIDFAPDGRIFVTERTGNLRVIQNQTLLQEPVVSLKVAGTEGGLLGVALDPEFEKNHFIYLYYTYNDFFSTFNKVVRYTESNNKLFDEFVLIDKIPAGPWHDGGRIKFGPDKKLYVTTGDAANGALAQDINSLAGKILRINSDGTIPSDNPFENSPVFSFGHRNPQGIDWDPITLKLVATEHGPSGEKGFGQDEINLIKPGRNYGWPIIVGDESKEGLEDPLLHTGKDTWAPSGAAFYDSDKIPEWYGKFFVATLRGEHLRMLDLDLENNKVNDSTALFAGEFGRLRSAIMGPDGHLYFMTSNQDGRGDPSPNDDRILRIVPLIEPIKEDTSLPPLKQVASGVLPENVLCKEGLELIFKASNQMPACVKETSAQKLRNIGWAK